MSKCNKAAGCLSLHNAWLVFKHSPRHKPEAWISFLINSPTQNCMCTNSVIFNVLLKKHKGACYFLFLFIFFNGGGGESEGLENFSFHGLSFPQLLNTRLSLLRKTKPLTLPLDTTAILMYQTNPVGVELLSLTLSFVSILSSIPEWLPQTHSFLKHNFVGFHLSFLLKRYRYN